MAWNREVIARTIWAYHECPWSFDNPTTPMAELWKQIATDQAELIRVALENDKAERGKKLKRLIFG